ncbi:hypothetical protein NLI96_g8826 [Meripilus lineatus]|uniref:Uncharacterized protein n=1 Tax=Meripilus lineatus TaxID=2056292 RepID=A0AAD5YBN2_9APHY|nr:hypothetical protein NLI96_g8826 [Physisporinus lineatus]
MRSLTLQYVPFKWSAPILQNLQSLVLRTLPSNHIALDRVLYIVAASPNLVNLSIHVGLVNPPVLPLNQTSLNELRRLNISGHYSLTALVESLSLPALEDLVFDIDARDPVDEIISSLVARSNNPPLTSLSILYAGPHSTGSGIYYAAGALITSWGFLADLDQLKTLQVGGAAFDPLVSVLASPDDDGQLDRWLCPNLTSLRMRGCHAHSDGVAKLVQMVEARNPDTSVGGTVFQANGASPIKLRCLEVHECGTLGVDVVEWLKVRVEDVVCTEPVCEGSPRSPSYHYL